MANNVGLKFNVGDTIRQFSVGTIVHGRNQVHKALEVGAENVAFHSDQECKELINTTWVLNKWFFLA